jgi:hypothetical protein
MELEKQEKMRNKKEEKTKQRIFCDCGKKCTDLIKHFVPKLKPRNRKIINYLFSLSSETFL